MRKVLKLLFFSAGLSFYLKNLINIIYHKTKTLIKQNLKAQANKPFDIFED